MQITIIRSIINFMFIKFLFKKNEESLAEARTHTNLSQAKKFPLVVKRVGVGELHTGAPPLLV